MIFLTVGTEFPFDRLVSAIDRMIREASLEERVFAQIGCSNCRPCYMDWAIKLEKSRFDELMQKSRAVISHAGIGTIMKALELHKPLLVMPRLKKYGEHVNDHQVLTSRKFESLGYVLVARETQDLTLCINKLRTFHPRVRNVQNELVVNYVKSFLDDLSKRLDA